MTIETFTPALLWSIEAAMWSAIEHSNLHDEGWGWCVVRDDAGSPVMAVYHERYRVPAFAFQKDGQDITSSVLSILRASAGTLQ